MYCRDSNAGRGCRSFGEAWGGAWEERVERLERSEERLGIRVERLWIRDYGLGIMDYGLWIWELEVTCNTTFRMVLLSLFQKNLRRRG